MFETTNQQLIKRPLTLSSPNFINRVHFENQFLAIF